MFPAHDEAIGVRPLAEPDPAVCGPASGRIRREFLAGVADMPTVLLPIHFPGTTAGRITGRAAGFDHQFL